MCMRIYTVLFFNFYFLCANKFLVYTVHFVFVHQWLSSYITGLKDLTLETDHESLLAFLKTGNLDEFKLIIQRFRTMLMNTHMRAHTHTHVPNQGLQTPPVRGNNRKKEKNAKTTVFFSLNDFSTLDQGSMEGFTINSLKICVFCRSFISSLK